MTPTDLFYYVSGGVIAPPDQVYIGTELIDYDPFARPTRVKESFIGENSLDTFLVTLGIYRLWVDAPPDPGFGYRRTEGVPTVVPDARVERVDTWEPIPASTQRAQYQAQIEAQALNLTSREIASDPTLKGNLDINAREIGQALSNLAVTSDEDLEFFDPDLSAHPLSNASYAASLVTQELETLARDANLTSTGVDGILTPDERAEMLARVAANSAIARGGSGPVEFPVVGVQRALASLEGEKVEEAIFKEVTFDWAAQDYFIPEVMLPRIPSGFLPTQTYAMIYDQENVYRSWMPFQQQPDGSWKTPSDVDYIAIAKPDTAVWRIAVAYGGTSAAYEITQRVILVPPDLAQSPVRWGGRT